MPSSLYLEPVIGYRSWWIDPETHNLDGRISRVSWERESKTEAICDQKSDFWRGKYDSQYDLPLDHKAPHEKCSCGLYGFHRLADAIKDYGGGVYGVVGAAVYWGDIVVHTAGLKAQFARPIALTNHRKKTKFDQDGRISLLESAIIRYNIPMLPYDLLESYAKTFGTQLGVEYFGE